MSQSLRFYVEFKLKTDQPGALEEAMKGPIELTQKDPNTLDYQFFVGQDVAYAIETYRDSDAFLAHMASVGPALGPLFAIIALQKMVVMGEASQAVKDTLAAFNPVYATHATGFTR